MSRDQFTDIELLIGRLDDIEAALIRIAEALERSAVASEQPPAYRLTTGGFAPAVMTNAIGGMSTATPRGVSR